MATPVDEADEILLAALSEMNDENLYLDGRLKHKDPKGLTNEYLRRLRKQIYGFDEIRGSPDLEAIDEKLRKIAEAGSRSPTPIFDSDDESQLDLQSEREAYDELVQAGGRPSHHPEDFDLVYRCRSYTKIVAYWVAHCGGLTDDILARQRFSWQQFREDQARMRSICNTPDRFGRFLEMANKYRRSKGKDGDIFWLQDHTRQSALEDWKEYQVWKLRAADGLAIQLRQHEKGVRDQEVKLQAAIDEGQAPYMIDDIRDYELASEEAGLRAAKARLKNIASLLEWIDEQLPIIASECNAATTAATSTQAQPESSGDAPRHITTSRARTKRKPDDVAEESSTKRQKRVSKAIYASRQSSATPAEIALSTSSVRARPNTRSRAKEGAATTAAAPAAPDVLEPLAMPEAPAMPKRQRRTAAASRKTKRPQRDPQTSVPNREAPNRPTAARTGKAARKAASQQKAGGSDRPLRRSERLARKAAIH